MFELDLNEVYFFNLKKTNFFNLFKHGFTSLHCAAQQGHVLIVKLLLENGASPDITNNVSFGIILLFFYLTII